MSSGPYRVLLVEDDEAYGRFVASQLAGPPAAFVLHRVFTVAEATSFPYEQVDVILLDLTLPDSTGLDTLVRVRQAAPDTPIVVLTAHDDDDLAIAAVQAGAEDYLVKGEADGALLTRALRYAVERAALRREVRSSEEKLRQAQKLEAIGRLAGGIAHDFNNVLTAIFGYTDLLLEQLGPEDPRRADVEEIRSAAERAASLTRQLLAFSRKQVMQPRRLDLNETVVGLSKLLARLVGADIELTIRTAPDLWPVMADPGQVEQVLMNLCANARDAMPEGGRLTIETRNCYLDPADVVAHEQLSPGPHVAVIVRDSGQGMPEQVRKRVFEPFFTTKEQGRGTGLGLATVYGIVKQSGGGISVASEEGQGTEFVIYLPALVEDSGSDRGLTPV